MATNRVLIDVKTHTTKPIFNLTGVEVLQVFQQIPFKHHTLTDKCYFPQKNHNHIQISQSRYKSGLYHTIQIKSSM